VVADLARHDEQGEFVAAIVQDDIHLIILGPAPPGLQGGIEHSFDERPVLLCRAQPTSRQKGQKAYKLKDRFHGA
jgi:hypothetical protein